MSEHEERLPAGPKGDKGKQGERGERGLPRGQARAVVYLFLLNTVFLVAGFFWLAHIEHVNDQQRCTSIEQATRIPVPHPVAGNPSREWEAQYEAIQAARGRQLGCRP